MTRYFAVRFAEHPPAGTLPVAPRADDWKPWVECQADDPIMVPLVLNQALRFRGGHGGERTPAAVFETAPIGTPPGQAKSATYHAFTIHPR